MKKIFALCLAAFMLVLAGCGEETEIVTTTESVSAEKTESFGEAVTAMGDIIITRANADFEAETTDEETTEGETVTEENSEAAGVTTLEAETEKSEPETQFRTNPDELVGGWQYVYEESGYTLIQRIYLDYDGFAGYKVGVYAGEYIESYDGRWYEENGTVYLELVGGDYDFDGETVTTEKNEFNMKLGWKEWEGGIIFIDYNDALLIGDGAGAEYNFTESEI